MIITKLIGGLGNQMFQYAAGRSLAHKLNTKFKLDRTTFKTYRLRKYELDCFSIKPLFTSQQEIDKFRKHSLAPFFTKRKVFKEKHFHFDPEFFKLSGDILLHGYWQSEKYFKNIKDIIRREFSFENSPTGKNKKMMAKILKSDSVSIHVRRTDYCTNSEARKIHGLCPLDYYQRAVEFMLCQIKKPVFFVFSDDPNWCKNNLRIRKAVFINWNKDSKSYEDMRLMSLCCHNIIANSTFSWWGAWLNKSSKKIIIAPKKWFADSSINTNDLIPRSWVKI